MIRSLFYLSLGFFGHLQAAEQPNFILINVDDQGYADTGPYGSNNATPNLDRMAKEGLKLTSHYAAPVCSPSRAAMMTGCYPKRVLPTPHVLFPAAEVGLNSKEVTVAEVLKEQGYKTACIGKWHLGDQKEFLPTSQGFDSYFGIPYSNDMGMASEGSKSNPGQSTKAGSAAKKKQQQTPKDETGLRGNTQPPLPLLENDQVVERVKVEGQHSITRRYTQRALDFIRASEDQPFFLYLPHTAVHFPLYPDPGFMGKSPNGLIGDWAQELDASTGSILDLLRELKLDGKTLVIYTSDNGGALNHGSNNQPLRGSKGSTLEGGIRVGTLAWWPGKILAGSSTGAITSHMDWLPTFAALAGASAPADRQIDGLNLTPLLFGRVADFKAREAFYYYRGFSLEAVRSGPWKLHLMNGELYHLEKDIGEARNVAADEAEVVKRLRSLAEAMDADLGREGASAPGIRPLGRVAEAQPLIGLDGQIRSDANARMKVLP